MEYTDGPDSGNNIKYKSFSVYSQDLFQSVNALDTGKLLIDGLYYS